MLLVGGTSLSTNVFGWWHSTNVVGWWHKPSFCSCVGALKFVLSTSSFPVSRKFIKNSQISCLLQNIERFPISTTQIHAPPWMCWRLDWNRCTCPSTLYQRFSQYAPRASSLKLHCQVAAQQDKQQQRGNFTNASFKRYWCALFCAFLFRVGWK